MIFSVKWRYYVMLFECNLCIIYIHDSMYTTLLSCRMIMPCKYVSIKIYLLYHKDERNEYTVMYHTDTISCYSRCFVFMLLFLVSSKRYIWVHKECGGNKCEVTWIVKIHNHHYLCTWKNLPQQQELFIISKTTVDGIWWRWCKEKSLRW